MEIDTKSIDSNDNFSTTSSQKIRRARTGSQGTGGHNTPSNQSKAGSASSRAPGASDADWDPFFESDD